MSNPTIFGKPMYLQALPGRKLYVLAIDNEQFVACVWERDDGKWVSRLEAATQRLASGRHSGPEEATGYIERRIQELVEALGPLVGWRKGKRA